jgi:hypothetical protein
MKAVLSEKHGRNGHAFFSYAGQLFFSLRHRATEMGK